MDLVKDANQTLGFCVLTGSQPVFHAKNRVKTQAKISLA
jgi:hypothetical protein